MSSETEPRVVTAIDSQADERIGTWGDLRRLPPPPGLQTPGDLVSDVRPYWWKPYLFPFFGLLLTAFVLLVDRYERLPIDQLIQPFRRGTPVSAEEEDLYQQARNLLEEGVALEKSATGKLYHDQVELLKARFRYQEARRLLVEYQQKSGRPLDNLRLKILFTDIEISHQNIQKKIGS